MTVVHRIAAKPDVREYFLELTKYGGRLIKLFMRHGSTVEFDPYLFFNSVDGTMNDNKVKEVLSLLDGYAKQVVDTASRIHLDTSEQMYRVLQSKYEILLRTPTDPMAYKNLDTIYKVQRKGSKMGALSTLMEMNKYLKVGKDRPHNWEGKVKSKSVAPHYKGHKRRSTLSFLERGVPETSSPKRAGEKGLGHSAYIERTMYKSQFTVLKYLDSRIANIFYIHTLYMDLHRLYSKRYTWLNDFVNMCLEVLGGASKMRKIKKAHTIVTRSLKVWKRPSSIVKAPLLINYTGPKRNYYTTLNNVRYTMKTVVRKDEKPTIDYLPVVQSAKYTKDKRPIQTLKNVHVGVPRTPETTLARNINPFHTIPKISKVYWNAHFRLMYLFSAFQNIFELLYLNEISSHGDVIRHAIAPLFNEIDNLISAHAHTLPTDDHGKETKIAKMRQIKYQATVATIRNNINTERMPTNKKIYNDVFVDLLSELNYSMMGVHVNMFLVEVKKLSLLRKIAHSRGLSRAKRLVYDVRMQHLDNVLYRGNLIFYTMLRYYNPDSIKNYYYRTDIIGPKWKTGDHRYLGDLVYRYTPFAGTVLGRRGDRRNQLSMLGELSYAHNFQNISTVLKKDFVELMQHQKYVKYTKFSALVLLSKPVIRALATSNRDFNQMSGIRSLILTMPNGYFNVNTHGIELKTIPEIMEPSRAVEFITAGIRKTFLDATRVLGRKRVRVTNVNTIIRVSSPTNVVKRMPLRISDISTTTPTETTIETSSASSSNSSM